MKILVEFDLLINEDGLINNNIRNRIDSAWDKGHDITVITDQDPAYVEGEIVKIGLPNLKATNKWVPNCDEVWCENAVDIEPGSIATLLKMNVFQSHPGGSHYQKFKIQPGFYGMVNELSTYQASAIKYITRYKFKGGALDLDKAIDTIQMIKAIDYGIDK